MNHVKMELFLSEQKETEWEKLLEQLFHKEWNLVPIVGKMEESHFILPPHGIQQLSLNKTYEVAIQKH
jgi:hypothetical protein